MARDTLRKAHYINPDVKKYGCSKLAHPASFSPLTTTNKSVAPMYCCIYCGVFLNHVQRGARTKFTDPYDNKFSKSKKKKFSCRDVMSLLDRGPGVRR